MKSSTGEDPLLAVIARAIARWLPPIDPAAVSDDDFQQLKPRNRGLDGASHLLCAAGLLGGVFLPLLVRGSPLRFGMADIGVLLGMATALPTVFILLIGVVKGKPRLLEFLTYYSVKYHIDARKLLLFIYIPVIFLGIGCACFSYLAWSARPDGAASNFSYPPALTIPLHAPDARVLLLSWLNRLVDS